MCITSGPGLLGKKVRYLIFWQPEAKGAKAQGDATSPGDGALSSASPHGRKPPANQSICTELL